jgi:MFS family permease
LSWRAAFFINVPLVLVALWATYRHVPESRDAEASSHFDWIGAGIVALAIGGLAFGAIYGQQREWRDPLGYIGLGVGVIFTAVLPVWMARARHPLIPLQLFRSRNFAVTNLSTLLIYGALYVAGYYLVIFQQGTLRYTAAAAGLGGLPGSLFLIFLSARFGKLASRVGPRWFMAAGPAIMTLGILWYARIPALSAPWRLHIDNPSTYLPPSSYLVDFLPASIFFGLGISMLVAPLTTALMRSVPVHNAGVASAINNAISRVGPQLAGALIFIFLTNSFYANLAGRVRGIDVNSPAFRSKVSPLNTPADLNLIGVVRDASTAAFHLAMLIAVVLLILGTVVNAVGIRNSATD